MKIFVMNYAGVRFLLYSISTHYTLKEKLMYKDIDQTFVSFQLALDSHYTHLNVWLSIWHGFHSDFPRLQYSSS